MSQSTSIKPSSNISLRKKPALEQALNVIYFIDDKKTHTLKISLFTLRVFLVGLFLMCLWAFTSVYWVWHLKQRVAEQQEQLKKNLAVLFNYKVRYDHVYEDTYKDLQQTKSLVASTPQLRKDEDKNNPSGSIDEASDQTASHEGLAKNVATAPPSSTGMLSAKDVPTNTATLHSNQQQQTEVVRLKLAEIKLRDPKFLYTKFSVTNLLAGQKVVGEIWGYGVYINRDGDRKYMGLPGGINLTEAQLKTKHRVTRYAIKRFKYIEFLLQAPEGGHYESIHLFAQSEGWPKIQQFDFTLDKKIDLEPAKSTEQTNTEHLNQEESHSHVETSTP